MFWYPFPPFGSEHGMLKLVSTVSQPLRCQMPPGRPSGWKPAPTKLLTTAGRWLWVGEGAQSLTVTGWQVWARVMEGKASEWRAQKQAIRRSRRVKRPPHSQGAACQPSVPRWGFLTRGGKPRTAGQRQECEVQVGSITVQLRLAGDMA